MDGKAMKKEPKTYYTPTELAELLSVNVMTIYRYIKARRFVAHKIGKEFRIERKEFERFLNSVKTK